jgi:tetratricopeptide (TPR) repeat protein
MAGALTANEEAQLLQTIEMFEVITQSQPMDYQSLEILKEAYSKLGREADVIVTSKRIAEAYVHLGQLSSAILEYESILQRSPDDPDVRTALADIENKANSFAAPPASQPETDFIEKQSAAAALRKVIEPGPAHSPLPAEVDDGRAGMTKLFVEGKLISAADFENFWPRVNLREPPRQPTEPFILTLSERQVYPLDKSLKALCEKTRMAFLPIDKYDVDVDFARSFPRETCMRWCVLPFDRMSKSILVATANPYNKQAARELEAHSHARVIWYASPPAELMKVIKKIFR